MQNCDHSEVIAVPSVQEVCCNEDDTSSATCCSVTYITCPADPQKTLAIKLPFLILVIKNMKKYFTFEVQVHFPAVSVCSSEISMHLKGNLEGSH